MGRRWGKSSQVVILVAVASACAGSRRDPPAARAEKSPAASASSVSSNVAAEKAVTSTALASPEVPASPVETTPEAPIESKPIPDPPGSTRGTVACGSERCVAEKQSCALDSNKWRCVDGRPEAGTSVMHCDDGTDCGPGLTCCRTGASAELVFTCTKRHGPNSACAMEVCKPDGARCPRGTHCDENYCIPDNTATCPGSGKQQCDKDEYCEWSAGTASCVKDPKPVEDIDENRGVFACTRQRDCGGGSQCCTSMGVFWRQTACYTNCDVTNTTFVCETAADCKRKLELVPPHMRHLAKLACKPLQGEGPAWLKVCELDLP